MSDPEETILGNTESTAPGIESTAPRIPCTGIKRETKPGTPRETTLEIPISTMPGTPDPSFTPRNMKCFHQA